MESHVRFWIASYPPHEEASEVEPALHQEINEERHLELHTLFTFAARYHLREEFLLVEENFNFFEQTHASAKTTGSPDMDREGKRLKVALLNWLLSFRAFLDHHETHIKRTYGGEESAEFTRFKERSSAAYDREFGYRFLYKLRNYSQHCGFPPIAINIDQTREPQVIQAILDRDELLREYDGWGAKVKGEIGTMGSIILVSPLVHAAMQEVRAIEEELLDIDAPRYQLAREEARGIRSLIRDENRSVALAQGQLQEDGSFGRLSLRAIPRWLTQDS